MRGSSCGHAVYRGRRPDSGVCRVPPLPTPPSGSQVEMARKAASGSPVSSEESGVPLKKRKVLVL